MGHTKPENLSDLAAELGCIRKLARVIEKSPGVFYWKRLPFLHFHDKDGIRWADIKLPTGGWERLDVDFDSSAGQRTKFMRAVKAAHASFDQERRG